MLQVCVCVCVHSSHVQMSYNLLHYVDSGLQALQNR